MTYAEALTYAEAAVEVMWGTRPQGQEILRTLHALGETSVVLDDYDDEEEV